MGMLFPQERQMNSNENQYILVLPETGTEKYMQKYLVFAGIGGNDFCVYFFILFIFLDSCKYSVYGTPCRKHGGYYGSF